MPKFSNGKITSSVLFYNRGVDPSQKLFAWYAGQNFSVIKQLAKYNKLNGIRN
jgi:hypothetical protein